MLTFYSARRAACLLCSGCCNVCQVKPSREGAKLGCPGGQLGCLPGRSSAVQDGAGKPICLGHSGGYKEDQRRNSQASLRKKEPFPKKWVEFIQTRKMLNIREQDHRIMES